MTKVIFFTAGPVPTTNENAALAKLNAQPIDVVVRNGVENNAYGAGVEACDYVAFVSPMTKPSAYSGKTTYDPDKPPVLSSIPSTQALVANGQKYSGVTVTGTGTFATYTVANGVVTAIALSSS